MLILGIETSCDETAASVCHLGERNIIHSNIIASQVETHKIYGGVVPEIASRAHSEAIVGVVENALNKANVTISDLDLIGVTNTPGLIGALLVGVNFAKSLAFAANKPLVAVNHIKAHVAVNYLVHDNIKPPFLALVVSGGHTSIIDVTSYTDFKTIGRTRDDAAGEAFDKIGRVLGLPYPCGAEMDKLSYTGNKNAYKIPLAAIPDETLDFSFSGMKTSVLNLVNSMRQKGVAFNISDIAASFTDVFTLSINKKLRQALDLTKRDTLIVAGGVSANSFLRKSVANLCDELGVRLLLPPLSLCGDNGAMIAAQAYHEYKSGNVADVDLNAFA